jgi:acetoacetyl-CoA synthetase
LLAPAPTLTTVSPTTGLTTGGTPVTLTGKKMEVPVRKILRGVPADEAVNRNAMANPDSLDFFIGYAAAHQDYSNA